MNDPNHIASYDFVLPEELIADVPPATRGASRLLVASLADDRHAVVAFERLLDHLHPGDLVVFNDSRVVPARVFGRKPTGGRVELLMLDVLGSPSADRWETVRGTVHVSAMYRSSKGLSPGGVVHLEDGERIEIAAQADGLVECIVQAPDGLAAWLAARGELPLPPYIVKRRETLGVVYNDDDERYQTVFAGTPGSVAAPTAGLHFTPALLSQMEARGIARATVTLEVGPGTFRPVKSDTLDGHAIHSERYHVPAGLSEAIGAARRVVAVGTTSVRVLETEARLERPFEPGTRHSQLFLKPGDAFHVVDAMLTNFHLPKSTLLALVAAFAGLERTHALYREAIAHRMRFYSYGDAMFLTRERLP